MLIKPIKNVLLIAALGMLAACSTAFRSDVATFHHLDTPAGERLMIVPMREDKKDSLEFQQYAAVLANHLRYVGYKATGEKDPDLIVGFDVEINDGREKLTTFPSARDPFYWHGSWHWGRYWPTAFPYDFDDHYDRVIARTVYTATLVMEVRKPDGELLFEGRAETESRNKTLPEIVPLLAEALFKSFPGETGVTRHVRIELDKNEH